MAQNNVPDPTLVKKILEDHKRHPEISVQAFIKGKLRELSHSIQNKTKIYLDTCYWIRIRDAELGHAKSSTFDKILKSLKQLVADGKIICPISDVTFLEILSQADTNTRNATAKLCDELSSRVALRSERYRAENEIESFIRAPASTDPSDILEQIWVRPCFIFGDLPVPHSSQISDELNLIMQKSTLESVWETLSFIEVSNESKYSSRELDWSENTAVKINADKVKWEHEIPSFKKALMAEIQGVLSVHSEHAGNVLLKIFLERGGSKDAINTENIEKSRESMHTMLVNAFRYAPNKIASRLPTTYVHSLCHAAVRYDKTRKFSGNLLRDFHHATAGIPYFQAMFTEKPLHVLLTSKHVNVNSIFPCQIFSDEEVVLQYLQTLN